MEKRRYADCQREDSNCAICSLASYGRDCHNCKITNLAYARMQAGLSQGELAKKAGVPVRTLQKYEQGQTLINHSSVATVKKLARVLNVKIVDILE